MKYSTILWECGGDHLAAIYETEMIHEVAGKRCLRTGYTDSVYWGYCCDSAMRTSGTNNYIYVDFVLFFKFFFSQFILNSSIRSKDTNFFKRLYLFVIVVIKNIFNSIFILKSTSKLDK